MAIRSIAGGLLTGIGTGLISDAEAKREAALQALSEKYRQEEKADDRNFRREETDLAYRRQLARDADSHDRNLERDDKRHTQRRGLLREKETDTDAGGLSANDQRVLDNAKVPHTTGKGTIEGEKVDFDATAKRLRALGREDLVKYVESLEEDDSGAVDPQSLAWMEAQEKAEAWASDKATWRHLDETDFAEWGGSRTEAIQQKALEYYQQMTGKKAPAQPDSEPAEEPAESAQELSGKGTQDDPFQPTTQAEFDTLPTGAVFVNPADGKLYRKN